MQFTRGHVTNQSDCMGESVMCMCLGVRGDEHVVLLCCCDVYVGVCVGWCLCECMCVLVDVCVLV